MIGEDSSLIMLKMNFAVKITFEDSIFITNIHSARKVSEYFNIADLLCET